MSTIDNWTSNKVIVKIIFSKACSPIEYLLTEDSSEKLPDNQIQATHAGVKVNYLAAQKGSAMAPYQANFYSGVSWLFRQQAAPQGTKKMGKVNL